MLLLSCFNDEGRPEKQLEPAWSTTRLTAGDLCLAATVYLRQAPPIRAVHGNGAHDGYRFARTARSESPA